MEGLPDQQIMQYVFKPGFSTAEQVTSVSGRGVGMDVVRTNIEKIGGTIELNSWPGQGSKFTIKIPLTLAIVSALFVGCAGERFAIPQLSVVELVRASPRSEYRIEKIKGTPVLRQVQDDRRPSGDLRAGWRNLEDRRCRLSRYTKKAGASGRLFPIALQWSMVREFSPLGGALRPV